MTDSTRTIVVLDGGWADTAEAEHAARESAGGLGPAVACTHFVPGERARVVVSLELATAGHVPADLGSRLVEEPAWVADLHRERTGGRAFRFPGSDALTGVLPVGDVVALSAVDEVLVIGGPPPAADVLVDTQDFVRPLFLGGRLVLHARPAAHVALVPFEQPQQIPCCADHAGRR